jgi:1-acyl-sn-glycerol-3-phosphate acyltransferase
MNEYGEIVMNEAKTATSRVEAPPVDKAEGKSMEGKKAEMHLQEGNAASARWYIRAFRLVLRGIFHLFFRIRVRGLKNVPSTPVIVCANHLGWTDPFLVLLFFPVEPRVYVLGEQQVKYISGFRTWVIDTLEIMVMLDRSKPVQALRIMQGVLERGGSLLIFPEGHLGTEEGKLLELQKGAAHLSTISGVPLLPVGLTGTSELWLRRNLTMRVGKPIYPGEFEGDTRTRMQAMTAQLDKSMRALLPGDRERPRFKILRNWLTKLL